MRYTSLYWNIIAPVARHEIGKIHGYEVGKRAYEGGRPAYKRLIEAGPNLGEGNPMEATFLQAMVFVALWQAAEGALSVADMHEVTAKVLGLKALGVVKLLRNANRDPQVLDNLLNDMHANETWASLHEGEYESAWRIAFDGERHKDGIFYEFTRCPIAEFCAAQGIEEITPVLCDIDYYTTKLIGSELHREHTLAASGPSCDYWIVPDEQHSPR